MLPWALTKTDPFVLMKFDPPIVHASLIQRCVHKSKAVEIQGGRRTRVGIPTPVKSSSFGELVSARPDKLDGANAVSD
jgi:hypothetical protein